MGSEKLEEVPATQSLSGRTLMDGRYLLMEQISATDPQEERARTACYRAVDNANGEALFIKAIDFRHEDAASKTDWLEEMVRQFNNEKAIAKLCRTRSLSRVTKFTDEFKEQIGSEIVHCLVFEHVGDDCTAIEDTAESCTVLHGIAAALKQLHSNGIAHHDPAFRNALQAASGPLVLCDLGSATCLDLPKPPHDSRFVIGSVDLAPPEALYHFEHPDRRIRHFSYDLYALGALLFKVFGIAGNPILNNSLYLCQAIIMDEDKTHEKWAGEYSQVIPDLRDALVDVVGSYVEGPTARTTSDVKRAICSLCDPEPTQRGHGFYRLRGRSPFDLQRWVSFFDHLQFRVRVASRSGSQANSA